MLCCTVTVTCAFRYDETSRCRFPLALSKTRSMGENPEAEPAEPQKPSVGSLIRSPKPPCDGPPSTLSVSTSRPRFIARFRSLEFSCSRTDIEFSCSPPPRRWTFHITRSTFWR